jgi:hypothetical protein
MDSICFIRANVFASTATFNNTVFSFFLQLREMREINMATLHNRQ